MTVFALACASVSLAGGPAPTQRKTNTPVLQQPVADPMPERICPPTPPPPSTATPVCGNGKAEDRYELIIAPCIPGRCCTEGWVASNGSEQCDGADLRGTSCSSLGFLSGALKCASDCTLDTSACTFTASPNSTIQSLSNGPQCGSGHQPALAWNGAQLAIAWPSATAMMFGTWAANGAPSGGGSLQLGGGYDQNALAEWASPHGPRSTVGTVVMAKFGDGYLAAVQRYGDDTSTPVVRIHANGTMQTLTAVRGRALFVAAGKSGAALVGFEGASVGLMVIGSDGTIGKPAFPFSQQTKYLGQLAASAAASEDGWIVAAGSRELPGPIELARVSKTGEATSIGKIADQGTLTAVTEGTPAQVVFLQVDGVFAANAATGKNVRKLQSERAFQILGAESGEHGLTVWLEGAVAPTSTGLVTRIHVDPDGKWSRESVVAVPQTRPCASLLQDGTLFLWLGDENNRVQARLFRGR